MGLSPKDLNKVILNKKLRDEYRQKFFFANMIGDANYNPVTNLWNMSESPIEKFTDFKLGATGNSLAITMVKNLYGYGFDGESTVLSNEKEVTFDIAKIFIHLKRHGVKIPSKVQAQKIDWMNLAKMYQPILSRWLAGYLNADVVAAALEGYSRHVTNSEANNGLGVTKKYPKNFWLWDGAGSTWTANAPTFSQTSATYKASLIAKMGTLDTADIFNAKLVQSLPEVVSQSNIQPYQWKGKDVYPVIISTRQEKTLKADSAFYNVVAQGMPRGYENPMFNSASFVWGKFVFFVDDVITRIAYHNSGVLDFFNYSAGADDRDNYTDPLDSPMYEQVQIPGTNQHVDCALILGKSCIGYAPFSDATFEEEATDYKMVKGMAIDKFYGLARLTFYDKELMADSEVIPTSQADDQLAVIGTYVA